MTKTKQIMIVISCVLLTAVAWLYLLLPVSTEDKVSDLNSNITVQERVVLDKYNIYSSAELDRNESKNNLNKLYQEKKELMGLSIGFIKTQ